MTVEAIEISDLASYVSAIEVAPLFGNKILFRGQPIRGNLLPSIAREDNKLDTTEKEKLMLEQLQLRASNLLSSTDDNYWNLIVKAQHHGMKTRCLDWTSNPLIALWFACANSLDKDSYVYMLIADGAFLPDKSKSPFEQNHVCIYQPSYESPRVSAQHGWLTVHNYNGTEFEALDNSGKMNIAVIEYLIPSKEKSELLTSLDRCGINQGTVFPDLDGICKYLNSAFA